MSIKCLPMPGAVLILVFSALPAPSQSDGSAVAFVNVSVIPMDREHVEAGQTVLVRGGFIAAIGAADHVRVPHDATVIDGAGHYLLPGLTDAHVHLEEGMPWAPTRPDFGDAPLYLAYGITTVVNLGGTPTQLDWRRQVEAGELTGPTIYTAGPFLNEPRVKTPDDVQREIVNQVRQGYDLIKFHELRGTTVGLSLPAYLKMNETARELGIPLVGHAPVNLGLDALLQARQSLAHVGMLGNLYFLPIQANSKILLLAGASVLLLTFVMAAWGVAGIVGRLRGVSPNRPPMLSRIRSLTGLILLASMIGLASAALFYPGGLLFDSIALRLLFTAAAVLIAAATLFLLMANARLWRDANASASARMQASLVSIASFALTFTLVIFWLPVSWRSTNSGIERVARRLHDAGITVQTTLVVYESLNTTVRARLLHDPAIDFLRPDTREAWHRQPQNGIPGYRYDEFMKRVTGALHRAGVPLVAGTDAMGLPLIVPGASLHRELELLTESGLTSFESIRAATVACAVFLGKDKEFGTIASGKRADLLLVERNPLQDLTTLRQPLGVMARGRWLTREQLQQMMTALKH